MRRTIHGARASICPTCRRVLAADLVQDESGVLLEKHCPEHGKFSTRIAADHAWLSGLQEFAACTAGTAPRQTAVTRGCPADCGECPDHRQKSAFFLFELTTSCDLSCPVCLGDAQECGTPLSLDVVRSMIRSVLDYAGPGQIISLGGGEPTQHPEFFEVVRLLHEAGFDAIWVYSNGRRIAAEPELARRMAAEGLYVILQWDGSSDEVYRQVRGRALLDEKKRALANLKAAGALVGLCPTIVAGINDRELGSLYALFRDDPSVGTLDIAPMAFVGRGATHPASKAPRITSQDVLRLLEQQSGGELRAADFSPISFAHPECLQIAYLLPLPKGGFIPLRRFLDPEDFRGLLLDKPLLLPDPGIEPALRDTINKLFATGKDDPVKLAGLSALRLLVDRLYPTPGKPLPQEQADRLGKSLVKVVLVHSYMDGLNFDLGRTRMCISRTMQPDGRMIPTCAFSVVHRSAQL